MSNLKKISGFLYNLGSNKTIPQVKTEKFQRF